MAHLWKWLCDDAFNMDSEAILPIPTDIVPSKIVGWDYLSMLGSKLIDVSKRDPADNICYFFFLTFIFSYNIVWIF